jgi:glycosyltransferase involved in cell wall biosynthesis
MVVVRNGPEFEEIKERAPQKADKHTIVYLGVLGPQDGVEALVHAAAELWQIRTDWRMVIAGDGECLADLQKLSAMRGLDGVVEFTGWLEPEQVDELLSQATIGLQPDPSSAHAQQSTMAKTIEYLGRGVPVIAVDLIETRRSAAEAARYVPTGTSDELAVAMNELLDDDELRAQMSSIGRARFIEKLAWDHQSSRYIGLWNRLLALPQEETS